MNLQDFLVNDTMKEAELSLRFCFLYILSIGAFTDSLPKVCDSFKLLYVLYLK